MSDQSSLKLPILAMSAIAGIHGGLVLYEFWKDWKKRRQREQITDYQKVWNGETRNGWSLLLPAKYLIGNIDLTRHRIVQLGWTVEDKITSFAMETGILIRSTNQLPDGKKIVTIYRYSLLSAEMNAELSKFVYDPKKWQHQFTTYMTTNSVASFYRVRETNQYRLYLTNVYKRKLDERRFICPMADAEFHLAYSEPETRRLKVMFGRWYELEPEDELSVDEPVSRYEIGVVSYDTDMSEVGSLIPIHSTTADCVSIPMGTRDAILSFPVSSQEMLVIIYNSEEANELERHICITYNRRGTWQMENLIELVQRYETQDGNYLSVLISFGQLKSPPDCCRMLDIPILRYLAAIETCPIGHKILALTKHGVLQRFTSAPSLKFLAAKRLYEKLGSRVKSMKREEVKQAIGVDVFEGFPEKESNERMPATYL